MKKIISLAALVAFTAVVGCGGTATTSAPTTKPSGSPSPATPASGAPATPATPASGAPATPAPSTSK